MFKRAKVQKRELSSTPQVSMIASADGSNGRLEELDSLRGLAALVVFTSHVVIVLAVWPGWLHALVYSPVSVFLYGGHQAVILFFILSGFVLYIPFTRHGYSVDYVSFLIKRVCRIYLPYLVASLFVLVGYLIFFRSAIPAGISPTSYGWRTQSAGQLVKLVLNCVLFIGWFNRDYLNAPTWTLAEEMRVSLIFPLLAMLVQRLTWRVTLGASLLCSALVSVAVRVTHHRSPFETLHYAALFLLGALLCSKREEIGDLWQRQGRPRQATMIGLSLAVCSYAPLSLGKQHLALNEEAGDWLIAVAACIVLVSALCENWFRVFLRHRTMQHLGRTSYGIYLLHLPCMFILINLLWNKVAHVAVFAMSLAVTILLATLFLRYIEEPSIALGKRLVTWRRERPLRRTSVVTSPAMTALSIPAE